MEFSSEHLKLISQDKISAFLLATGWKRKALQGYASIWSFADSEILIPTAETRDFLSRIREAILEISKALETSEISVFRQIISSGFKELRISSVGPGSNDGTVSFEDGCKLVASVRDLLVASASATVEPRRVYSGKRPDLVSAFIGDARLGQTEHGSFVLTVLAPVAYNTDALLPGIVPPPPFGERVIATLFNATHQLTQETARSYSDTGWLPDSLVSLVEHGVSANLCAALSNMLEVSGIEKIVLSASNAQVDSPKVSMVEIPTLLNERLAQAAVALRKDPPLEGVTIEGTTTSFRRDNMKEEGRVSVKAVIGGERRRVSFSLPTREYNVFLEAHKSDRIISLRADLKKSGATYEATNVRELRALPDKDLFLS